jgi:hypothetical protein
MSGPTTIDLPVDHAGTYEGLIPTTPFRKLAALFDKLERTSSSNAMITALARFLPALSPEEVKMTAYPLAGRIGSSFSAPEIGFGQVFAVRARSS